MATPTSGAALTLSGITKIYPGVRALSDVSVTVRPGVVHAVLGENGAGKSTLVGIAAGSVVPNEGTIDLGGVERTRMETRSAREEGLAIVYQIPALAPSLSVLDAMLLLLPESKRPARSRALVWVSSLFERLGLEIDPRVLVSALTQREAHLVEIAAALASDPRVLVLDEPTEALGPEETLWLFARIHELLALDVAVIYITHRIPEVVEIATDLTVLRDGRVVGRGKVRDYTEDEIVEMIVGRSLETTFPDKAPAGGEVVFEVAGATGPGFSGISLSARSGEISGLAGVEGNGQREFMRALGGHGRFDGQVRVGGRDIAIRSPRSAVAAGVVFLPGDRLGEAMFGRMSVRENLIAPSVTLAMPAGFVSPRTENGLAEQAIGGLAVKTPTLETPVSSLSGGSQQKVLLARARLGNARVILVEDPTQGVDAGARVEIYAFLRRLALSGVAVVILSTDAVELEGLCDSVHVFSRGRVMADLRGDDLTERAITGAAVLATGDEDAATLVAPTKPPRRRRLHVGGETQAVGLIVLAVVLSVATTFVSSSFASSLNLSQLLAAASTLVLVGVAQLVVVMTGGIDLSIGSVVALAGVVISFFGTGGPGYFVLGVVLAVVAGALVGVVNGLLVTRLTIPPVIATLVTSIAVLGVAQVLRPQPGGQASSDLMTDLGLTVGVVPVVLIVAVVIAAVLWFVIARTGIGRGLRAAGSDPVKANRMGVRVPRMRMSASIAAGVLAAVAGLTLFTQTGIGDANSAQALTLTSVTAVVIAGASIFGGSGSALAVAAGALLLETITSALNFLSLGLSWQYWFQGIFVLIAAVLPMIARYRARKIPKGLNR